MCAINRAVHGAEGAHNMLVTHSHEPKLPVNASASDLLSEHAFLHVYSASASHLECQRVLHPAALTPNMGTLFQLQLAKVSLFLRSNM
jgi:hypothetical protein